MTNLTSQFNDLHEAYNNAVANPTVENMYLVRAAECQFNNLLDAKTVTQSAINSKTGEWEVLPKLPVVDKVLFSEY